MDKKIIIKNFSRYACFYDKYADVQKFAADKLLEKIENDNFKLILEIGCGTGNYTAILRQRFPAAKLKAIDISDKMVQLAQDKLKDRDIEFIIADAEEMNLARGFDLITSNACFQWFADLEMALIKYKELLKIGGVILFSIFGPLTFWELDMSLKDVLGDVSLTARNFIGKEKIKNMLNKDFEEVRIKEISFKQTLKSLMALLDKIRYTGIRGNGLRGRVFLHSRLLDRLEKVYLDKFGEIKATYQIFFCKGQLI